MKTVKLAVGSQQQPISLGMLNCTEADGKTNVYYNIDLGQNKNKLFNFVNGFYEDLQKFHASFHHSGQGHLKPKRGSGTIQKGFLSDASTLINPEQDFTILGIESIDLDYAPSHGPSEDNLVLSPSGTYSQYSILWLLVPPWHPCNLPNRMLWANFWEYSCDIYSVQTASLSDILISHQLTKILTVIDWCVCACFLNTLLPVLKNNDVTLVHPKGQEKPWRAFTFVDSHLPLAQMIRTRALTKPKILTSHKPFALKKSEHPSAWVKDGTSLI
jgi:hypothetical protein